jgi:ribosomal protein L29
MDANGLRGLDDQALIHQELSWEFELTRTLLDHRADQLQNVSVLKKLRRNIARAQTVQRERESAQGIGRGTLRNTYRPSFNPRSGASAAGSDGEASGGFLSGVAGRFGLGGDES